MSNNDVTAAAIPVIFGNHEFECNPLCDKDVGALNLWCRGQFIAMARASLEGEDRASVRDETMSLAMREAASVYAFFGTGARMMSNPQGIARIIWQGVRHNHPDVTHERISSILMEDPEYLRSAKEILAQIRPYIPKGSGTAKNSRNGKSTKQKKDSTKS